MENSNKQLIHILLAAIVLLALGEAYLIFAVSAHPASTATSSGAPQTVASTSPTFETVTTALQPIAGTIAGIGANSFTVSRAQGSATSTITVTVSGNTQIFSQIFL